MGIFSWMIFGLIAAAMAKVVLPTEDLGGWVVTVMVGIAGAIFGGLFGNILGFGGVSDIDFRSLLVAIVGSTVVLYGYRRMKKRRV